MIIKICYEIDIVNLFILMGHLEEHLEFQTIFVLFQVNLAFIIVKSINQTFLKFIIMVLIKDLSLDQFKL